MRGRLSLAVVAMALLARPAQSVTFRQSKYPLCPITQKPPVPQTRPNTRCVDSFKMTCCDRCQDIRQALGLVSANFSDFVQWLGLTPPNVDLMNSQLNGTDASMCTAFSEYSDTSKMRGQTCADHIEQLACAMSCHPESGDFVQWQDDGSYLLYVCKPYYFKLVGDCNGLALPKEELAQVIGSYIGYGPQVLNDIGNVAWGLSGLPEFRVRFSNATGPPGCWKGPPEVLPKSACCDGLSTAQCPKRVVNFTANPHFRRFANAKNLATCRAVQRVEGQPNITAFSPPPLAPPPPRRPSPPPPSPPPNVIALNSPPMAEAQVPPPPQGNAAAPTCRHRSACAWAMSAGALVLGSVIGL